MDVDVAEAVGVAEDGDARVVLDVADKLVGTARNAEVDILVLRQKGGNGGASCDELDGGVGDRGVGQSLGDDASDG